MSSSTARCQRHREAPERERSFMMRQGEVSKIATLRGMAVAGNSAALVEIKAVDDRYPLYGRLDLEDGGTLRDALAQRNGRFGVVADPLLLGRLGIAKGTMLKIGSSEFDLRAVLVRTVRPASVGWIANSRFGIAHLDEKLPGRLHHDVHGVHAAMEQHDVRRGRFRERVGNVGFGNTIRVEREDAVFQRTVHRDRAQHAVLRRFDRRFDRIGRRQRRIHCAAGEHRAEHECSERQTRARLHASRWRARSTIRAAIDSTSATENAVVRYDIPACSTPALVVAARTIGVSGPVGTARTYSGGGSVPPAASHSGSTLTVETAPQAG